MKKLCLSVALILAILTATLLCTRHLDNMIEDMNQLIDEAEYLASEKNYASAEEKLREALDIWQDNDPFTSVFLSYDKIEGTTDAFYEALKNVINQSETNLIVSHEKLKNHLQEIQKMEHMSLSSIF